jgi:16S rRNA (uracil1498-N3)-methyltransferase
MRYIIMPTNDILISQTMPRFYCLPPLPNCGTFELPADAAHHALRVLRLREGNYLEIFDGRGNECTAKISEIKGKHVVVTEITATNTDRESPLKITLAQALSSTEKLDWVIQKATELGVTNIQPLATERSVTKLSQERSEKRIAHWRQVAIAACEQCGRNELPVIFEPLNILTWLQHTQALPTTKLILLPESNHLLSQQPKPIGAITLLIGAEGGFTTLEKNTASNCNFVSVCMGPRVLRTETAAVAGIAALQTLWGDLS